MDRRDHESSRRSLSHPEFFAILRDMPPDEVETLLEEFPTGPPNTPIQSGTQLSTQLLLTFVTYERFAEDQWAQPGDPTVTQNNAGSGTMSGVNGTHGFLDPSSAAENTRKTKQKAEAVRIAKQQEVAVHEKLKRSGLEVPKYEFLELIGKGAYGRVFKRYVPIPLLPTSGVSGLVKFPIFAS